MKKLAFLVLSFVVFAFYSQSNKIQWGVGIGLGLNPSEFHDGDKMANIRFEINPLTSTALFLNFRKDFHEHWALMGSIEIRNIGFEYVFGAEEYSLIRPCYKAIRQSSTVLQLPILGLYKSSLNCRNKRWILGLGIAPATTEEKKIFELNEANLYGNPNVYEINTHFSSSFICFGKWLIGREKVFKNGNILMWGVEHLFNKQITATSEINYTINGKNYHHIFKNTAKFTGIFFRYLFGGK